MAKVIIGNKEQGFIRFGFNSVFEARKSKMYPQNPANFTAVVIIPKDHPQVAEIQAAIKAAADEGWSKKKPANLNNPLRDGDTDKAGNEAFAGMYFITASSNADNPPGVIDALAQPAEKQDWNSGDYGRVSVNFYPSLSYNKIGVGLNNVQFVLKGEPLSERVSANQEFGVEAVEPNEAF